MGPVTHSMDRRGSPNVLMASIATTSVPHFGKAIFYDAFVPPKADVGPASAGKRSIAL